MELRIYFGVITHPQGIPYVQFGASNSMKIYKSAKIMNVFTKMEKMGILDRDIDTLYIDPNYILRQCTLMDRTPVVE